MTLSGSLVAFSQINIVVVVVNGLEACAALHSQVSPEPISKAKQHQLVRLVLVDSLRSSLSASAAWWQFRHDLVEQNSALSRRRFYAEEDAFGNLTPPLCGLKLSVPLRWIST